MIVTKLRHFVLVSGAVASMSSLLPCTSTAAPTGGKLTAPTASCADLAKLALPNATITAAESIAAGQYHLSDAALRDGRRPGMNVAGRTELAPNSAYCRVAATLKPTRDSNIKVEVIRQYGRVEARRPISGDVGCAASRAELHAENESSANNE